MTEEIIIDGVDVSECEKLGETIAGITCGLGKRIRFANEIITKHNLCKDNPNCNYKQLKRLEQENEHLKKQNEILLGQLVINDGEDVTVQISQSQFNEYNELKEENARIKQQYNCYACGNCKGKEDYINLEKHHKGLRKQFDKQNKKLRDIHEIVQDYCNACKEFEPEKSEDKKTCLYCNYGKILGIKNDQKEREER